MADVVAAVRATTDGSEGAPVKQDHEMNPAHGAPPSDAHKAELEKHDVTISPGHVNHGHGHH